MAHDGKISRADFREYKKRAQQTNEELLRLQKVIDHLTSSANVVVSSDFATLQIKYQGMLTRYSDKLIFYQCFIYLIPEFYIDGRGESIRKVVRQLLDITKEEDEMIIQQLIHFEIVEVIGGLIYLKDKTDAKVALNELVSSGKLDVDQLIEKFVSV